MGGCFRKIMETPSLQETVLALMEQADHTNPIEFALSLDYKDPDRKKSLVPRVVAGHPASFIGLCGLAARLRRVPVLMFTDRQLLLGRLHDYAQGTIFVDGDLSGLAREYLERCYVADVLRARRLQPGFYRSSETLARALGWLPTGVRGIEAGAARPNNTKLEALCAQLKLTPQWLPEPRVLNGAGLLEFSSAQDGV